MEERVRRVVLVHRYYWPDSPPYASMLHSIARRLAADGFDVSVITAQPSYGDSADHGSAPTVEVVDGVHIRRVALLPERKDQTVRRILNLVIFAVKVASRIVTGRKPDAVMAATTPPVVVAAVACAAVRIRRASFVYHNQDIYPEVLGPPNGRVAKATAAIARAVDCRTGRAASKVVVLSEDMADTWVTRGLERERVVVINNFDTLEGVALPDVPPAAPGMRRVVFAGNVGRFQDVRSLVAASNHPDLDRLELIIVGDGVDLDACREVAGTNCRFVGRVDPAEASAWVASADAAVISLQSGLYRYVYPSKTFTYLAVGTPLLARVEQESELAQMIVNEQIGWVAAPRDRQQLDAALHVIQRATDKELGSIRARIAPLSKQSKESVVLDDWYRLFDANTRLSVTDHSSAETVPQGIG